MICSAEDSSIDKCQRIMIDANIAIAYIDTSHKFHSQVKKRLQTLYANGAIFFYPQPVLLEVKDYWRRKLLTETIRTHISGGKRLYNKFEKLFKDFEEANKNEILYDRQIKKLRETLEPIAKEKGVEFWFALCKQALNTEFSKLDIFLSTSSFKYAKFNDGDVYPKEDQSKWPNWDQAYGLMEKFGLGSSDAAILNMVNGGKAIDGFFTNDGDLLFAIAKDGLNPATKAATFLNISI